MVNRKNSSVNLISFEDLFAAVKRHIRSSLILAMIFAVLGLVYAFSAPPVYRATSSILIDNTRVDKGDRSETSLQSIGSDMSIASQIELINSITVAELVVEDLQLHKDSRFFENSSITSLISSLRSNISSLIKTYLFGVVVSEEEEALQEATLKKKAVDILRDQMIVVREPLTLVIHLGYDSHYPELAAKIADAISKAYLQDQLNANYEANVRVSQWIEERVAEMNKNSIIAGLEVEEFPQTK